MKEIMDFMDSMDVMSPMNSYKPSKPSDNDHNDKCTCLNKLPLAYSYTPVQKLDCLYSYSEGLKNGTMFPELNMPLGVYGNNFCNKEGK